MKQQVWRYIKQGNKATTPKKFAQALVSDKMVSNVVVFGGHISNYEKPQKMEQLKGITTFNEFIFESDHILVRLQSGIGEGKKISGLEPLTSKSEYICEIITPTGVIKVNSETDPKDFLPKQSTLREIRDSNQVEKIIAEKDTEKNAIYDCPNDVCQAEFLEWYLLQTFLSCR